MSRLIVFGSPNGFSSSDCSDAEIEFFQKFNTERNGIQIRMYMRPDGNHNILSVYPEKGKSFFDINGNNVGFFCIDFVSEKNQIMNPMQMQSLLKKTYEMYIKNRLIQETPDGDRKFLITSLKSQNNQIANDIYNCILNIIKTNPELDVFKNNSNQSIFNIINQTRSKL
ncbi:MAG: hypothetical protein IKN73_03445 [Alphaproteobacteria bacterium]|nr:hypothetical protein [Alphaproteobacteria bacterium]